MSYFSIDQIPTIPLIPPLVSDERVLVEYGLSRNDEIIQKSSAPQYRPLAEGVNKTINFKRVIMYDAWNQINRIDLNLPSESDDIYIISGRGILQSILNCFLFAADPLARPRYHDDIAGFKIERQGNKIYFGHTSTQTGPKKYDGDEHFEGYGIAFEELVATHSDPNMRAFYRFNAFTLLNKIRLVVRAEVDCVDENGHYYEVKIRRFYDPNFPPVLDVLLMRGYWGQMFLGLAHSLILGQYSEIKDGETAEVLSVEVIPAAHVQQLAQVHGISLQRFATLLEWIKANMQDGDKKVFSYSVTTGLFSLHPHPPP